MAILAFCLFQTFAFLSFVVVPLFYANTPNLTPAELVQLSQEQFIDTRTSGPAESNYPMLLNPNVFWTVKDNDFTSYHVRIISPSNKKACDNITHSNKVEKECWTETKKTYWWPRGIEVLGEYHCQVKSCLMNNLKVIPRFGTIDFYHIDDIIDLYAKPDFDPFQVHLADPKNGFINGLNFSGPSTKVLWWKPLLLMVEVKYERYSNHSSIIPFHSTIHTHIWNIVTTFGILDGIFGLNVI